MGSSITNVIEGFMAFEKNIQPTKLLYNEGWMLRFVLKWFDEHREIKHDMINIEAGSRLFFEAALPTKFSELSERELGEKDKLWEPYTTADGVYGNFKFDNDDNNGYGNLELLENCKQFVVVEAKMFSPFKKGVKNAKEYNQVARTIACMCNVVANSGQNIEDIDVSFFTIIPKGQEDKIASFKGFNRCDCIKNIIKDRYEQYSSRLDYNDKKNWYDNNFLPLCEKLFGGKESLKLLFWEDIIKFIKDNDQTGYGESLEKFYDECYKYNNPENRKKK